MNNIEQLIKKFDHGKDYPSKVTKAARNFIKSDEVKCYGWGDSEFINGYQHTKEMKVTVMVDNRIQTIWNFITAKGYGDKVGYIVSSWRDQFNVQVSKEDGNTAYLMIMQKAKEIKGAKIIIETL